MVIEFLDDINAGIKKLNEAYLQVRGKTSDAIIERMVERDKKSYANIDFYQKNPNLIRIDCIGRYMIKYTGYLDTNLNWVKDEDEEEE